MLQKINLLSCFLLTIIMSNGIPQNLRVIADKVNPHKFYALDLFAGKLYSSEADGNTFNEQTLNTIQIPKTGDPKIYGRVYIGTHGRGISYGDERK